MAQAVHTRSLETVAVAFVYVPAAHTEDTAAHASPESASENVVPNSQAAHTRSASSAPSTDFPSPTAQVAHAAHESVDVTLALALALK